MLDHAASVKSSLGIEVCGVRCFGGVEVSDMQFFAMDLDVGAEPAGRRFPTYSQVAGLIIAVARSTVLKIDGVRNVAKIVNAVVAAIPVNVVDIALGPTPIKMKPSETVREECVAVKMDLSVAESLNVPGDRSSSHASSAFAPSEDTCFRVVVEQFANALCGKICGSHAASVKGWVVRAGAALKRCSGSLIIAPECWMPIQYEGKKCGKSAA